jgi:hypothetical protein
MFHWACIARRTPNFSYISKCPTEAPTVKRLSYSVAKDFGPIITILHTFQTSIMMACIEVNSYCYTGTSNPTLDLLESKTHSITLVILVLAKCLCRTGEDDACDALAVLGAELEEECLKMVSCDANLHPTWLNKCLSTFLQCFSVNLLPAWISFSFLILPLPLLNFESYGHALYSLSISLLLNNNLSKFIIFNNNH